jgi:glycine/D-amino acid oxidase-like deaminating enzyme
MTALSYADAVVIGGGFFGCAIALELSRLGLARIVLCERQPALMRRASYVNQARTHNGYHYPRSLGTAESSHRNFERFIEDYRFAVKFDMESIYAIAATSRMNATQFMSFCAKIGAPCVEAPRRLVRLFDEDLIEEAFLAREFVFDADRIARDAERRLAAAEIDVRLSTSARVEKISQLDVTVATTTGRLSAGLVVNCTYAAIDDVGIVLSARLKRELTEMILIRPPKELETLGITVMDGPYFSTLPFPATPLHSLSHVRFTPHEAGTGKDFSQARPIRSNAVSMLRDAARYVPCLSNAEMVRSIFELKAILMRNEVDDGRPILFEVSPQSDRILTIMGSKIDNIYDAIDAVRSHRWEH